MVTNNYKKVFSLHWLIFIISPSWPGSQELMQKSTPSVTREVCDEPGSQSRWMDWSMKEKPANILRMCGKHWHCMASWNICKWYPQLTTFLFCCCFVKLWRTSHLYLLMETLFIFAKWRLGWGMRTWLLKRSASSSKLKIWYVKMQKPWTVNCETFDFRDIYRYISTLNLWFERALLTALDIRSLILLLRAVGLQLRYDMFWVYIS